MDELQNLELAMADFVKQQAPEDVQEFIDLLSTADITQEEVDEFRQIIIEGLTQPSEFPKMVRYLIRNEFIEEEDAPKEYDQGFALAMLGLVGVAQSIVGGQS